MSVVIKISNTTNVTVSDEFEKRFVDFTKIVVTE